LALQANDLFGEHAPLSLGRDAVHVPGTRVEVAAFASLLDSVLAYMTNINRHPAYAKLRALRAQHRREGRRLDGYALAAGLIDYSARGMAYVDTLRQLIREHKLHRFDAVPLDTAGGTILVRADL
jgi:Bax protein